MDSVLNRVDKIKDSKSYKITTLILVVLVFYIIPLGAFSKVILTILVIYGLNKLEKRRFLSGAMATPDNWWKDIGGALLKALILSGLSVLLIKLIIFLGGSSPDYGRFEKIQGNPKLYFLYLIQIWTVITFGEEIIFRGFLMTRMKRILGNKTPAVVANIIITTLIFSYGHLYQGTTGLLSAIFLGLMLATNFIYKNYNLWQNILMHGLIDTFSFTLLFWGINFYS